MHTKIFSWTIGSGCKIYAIQFTTIVYWRVPKFELANPSTQGSGRKVLRSIPITLMIVLMAAIPSHPDFRATLAGFIKEESLHENSIQLIPYNKKKWRFISWISTSNHKKHFIFFMFIQIVKFSLPPTYEFGSYAQLSKLFPKLLP